MKTSVSIGITSVLGWLGAAAGVVTAVTQSLQEHQDLLTHGNKAAGIAGLTLLALTNGGRHYQAANLPGSAQVGAVLDELPAALRGVPVLAVPPDADHQDGPGVAHSGAPPAA